MRAKTTAVPSGPAPGLASTQTGRQIDPRIVAAGQQLAVFLPNYNHGRYLPQALDALLAQTVPPREICVLDDASTDDSRDIIAGYASRFPLIRPIYRSDNRGVTRNVSDWLAQSTDRYVFFAAADDVVMPDLFERTLVLFEAYPAAGLCSALSRLLDADGRDLGSFDTPRPLASPGYIPPADAARFLMDHDSWFQGGTTIYNRMALVQAGGFDEALAGFSDGFACRLVALTQGACFIPRELGYWRRMTSGVAAQTTGTVENALAVADHAEGLMKVSSPPFPHGYAERWRQRWLFGAATTLIKGQNARQRRSSLLVLFASSGAIERFAVSLLASLPEPLIRLMLFVAMRPRDILPAIRRLVS